MTDRSSSPRRSLRTWHLGLLVAFLIGGFSLLFHLGDAKSLGSHEGYAIIPAREMLLSGDYVVPRFGEMPRLQKPPLIYWSIIASAKTFGGLDIWSARLPAALSGLLLAALMGRWAYRWYGGIAAAGAVAAQLTSVYMLVFGRKAEADMILVLLIATALYIVVEQKPEESRRASFLRWTGIWACAAISWLGKFHFGPVMIFVPAMVWLVLERRWRFLPGMINPIGMVLFLAAAGIWPMLVLDRLPGAWEIWQSETIGRVLGELGRQPIWYYLPHLATWTLPWTIFAVLAWPASLRAAWGAGARGSGGAGGSNDHFSKLTPLSLGRGAGGEGSDDAFLTACNTFTSRSWLLHKTNRFWRRIIVTGDARERFLWVWLGVTLAIVTVSANKHPHYILPALPAFSLWTARRFAQLADQAREGKRLLSAPLAAGLTLTAAGIIVGLSAVRDRLPSEIDFDTLLPIVAFACAGTAIVGWLLYLRRNGTAAMTVAASWLIGYGVATVTLVPSQDHRIAAYRFGENVRRQFGGDSEIGIHGIDQDAILWYLGEPAFRTETTEQLAQRLESKPRLRVITIEGREPELSQVGQLREIARIKNQPGLPTIELGHYQQMVLVELTRDPGPVIGERTQREPR